MSNVESLGATYDEAFSNVSESLGGLERAVNAALLTLYPHREVLAETAVDARKQTGADAVEINALVQGKQITLIAEPGKPVRTTIRDRDSLCVLAVGSDKLLWIEDMQNSEFLRGHSAKASWSAWVSAPVHINNFPVGSVCALQKYARQWTDKDKEVLTALAQVVGEAVEKWTNSPREESSKDVES